jgi:hypothetical protein
MSCFFFAGVYFADNAWAGFFVLPFGLSILYGYFRKAIGEAFRNALVGLVLYGSVMAILLCVLSSFEPFWVYLEPFSVIQQEITTFDEAVGVAAMSYIGVFMLQIGLGILGVLIGIGTEKLLGGILQPPKEHAREQPPTQAVIG